MINQILSDTDYFTDCLSDLEGAGQAFNSTTDQNPRVWLQHPSPLVVEHEDVTEHGFSEPEDETTAALREMLYGDLLDSDNEQDGEYRDAEPVPIFVSNRSNRSRTSIQRSTPSQNRSTPLSHSRSTSISEVRTGIDEELENTLLAEPSLWDKLSEVPSHVKGIFDALVVQPVKSTFGLTRRAGLSVKQKLERFLDFVFDNCKNFVDSSYHYIIDTLFPHIKSFVTSQYNKVVEFLRTNIRRFVVNWQEIACFCVGVFILGLSVFLKKRQITKYARILMGIMGVLSMTIRSWEVSAVSAVFATVLLKVSVRPEYVISPQGEVADDFKGWIGQLAMVVSLMGCCVAGMSIPTDSKSLDALLKRSALVGRSYQTVTVIGEKVAGLVETSVRMVCKYVYGTEYVSASHIPDVEALFKEVMALCGDPNNIVNDLDKMRDVEAMYAKYLHLSQLYGNDQKARAHLSDLGRVITYFYKMVCMKNPRSYTMRQEPVCIVFSGDSGLGKSYLMSPLQQDLLKIAGKIGPDNDFSGRIYSRCTEHEFWDGYAGQDIVIYDDFAQRVDDKTRPNEEFFEIIRTVNIFPLQLHSASLEQKANNAFRASFVVLTTNCPDITPVSLYDKKAFSRRMHMWYAVNIIDEVKTDNKLDVHKLHEYRERNNLPIHDMSHYKFIDKYNEAEMTYEELVVAISRKYKSHVDAYEARVKIAYEKQDEKLPTGAYSKDERWLPQSTETGEWYLPLDSLMMLPQHLKDMVIQRNVKVAKVVGSFYREIDEIDTWDQLENFMKQPKVLELCHREEMEYYTFPELEAILKRKLIRDEDLKEAEEAIKNMHARCGSRMSRVRSRLYNVLKKAYEGFKYYAARTYDKIAPIVKWCAMLIGTFGALMLFVKARNFAFLFGADKYGISKISVLRFLSLADFSIALSAIWFKPFLGSISLLVWMSEYYHHYVIHPEYKEGCNECVYHMEGQKKLEDQGLLPEEGPVDFVKLGKNIERISELSKGGKHDEMIKEAKSFGTELGSFAKSVEDTYQTESTHRDNIPRTRLKFEDPEVQKLFGSYIQTEGIISAQARDVASKIRRNMYDLRILFMENGKVSVVRVGLITIIKGKKALINAHFLQRCGVYYKQFGHQPEFRLRLVPLMNALPGEGIDFGVEQFRDAVPLWRGPHRTEFLIWTLPKMNLGCDLTKYMLTTKELEKMHDGVRLQLQTFSMNPDKTMTTVVREGRFVEFHLANLEDPYSNEIKHYPGSACYEMSTENGDCGAPLIVNDTGFQHVLFGFHFGGKRGFGSCSVLTVEDIQKYVRNEIAGMETSPVQPTGDTILPQICSDPTFPLAGSFQLIGTLEKPVVQPLQTSLRPSLVYGFRESKVRPARMRPALHPDGPMLKGLQKNAGSVVQVDHAILDQCVMSYIEKLTISPILEIERRVLTFEEACAGIAGEKYFPPLRRSKSAGWPWMNVAKKGKTDWLGSDTWEFNSKQCSFLKQVVNEMERLCQERQVPEAYFVDTLKDEKRPHAYVDAEKTRVFSAAPMHFSILFRKYFLGFIAFMSRTRYINESAVGTNVYSRDWAEIATRMLGFGDGRFFDGDFKNFDGTVNYHIFYRIIDIVNGFYADGEGNANVRRVLWELIVGAPHILYSFVYLMSHGQPSGNPATAPFNSIYVSLALRYTMAKIGISPRKFNYVILLMTYGDDFFISVRKDCDFNFVELASAFENIGMKITSASKEEVEDKPKKLSEIQFLKRRFVCDEENYWWYAPLEEQSIVESCNWIHKTLVASVATKINVEAAQYELFHHEKKVYQAFLEDLVPVYRKNMRKMLNWMSWENGRMKLREGQLVDISQDILCI